MATLTTRSRTGLFLSYRDSRAPSRARTSRRVYDVEDNEESENERLIRPMIDIGFSVQAEVLPPTWYVVFLFFGIGSDIERTCSAQGRHLRSG